MTAPDGTGGLGPQLDRGRKLLHLYRRGVGGERTNAGRLLLTHLKTHDLTLYDLDPSLPVSQDLSDLDRWRESAALLAQIGKPEQDDVLTRLVDATDLTETELARLLQAVDTETLVDVRADGWAYTHGGNADDYRRAARQVTPAVLLAGQGSLADRLLAATLHRHHLLTHPERNIRASDELQKRVLLGLIFGLTGHRAEATEAGVRAHLNADQLARVRALLAGHGERLKAGALDWAETQAAEVGRGG
ncbi:hypothetical protein GCM10010840_33310 [Deinococcus aerolatus]|uniref:Uncharacterized protein n=1 Tax=Deinococcus aerolatus TaxID=522487 RepID=A0ABQ2GEP8_9DEIO|nr:hypothetical protein [Deinococcus aerolatus]GGL92491.1 hypothetical protein GCM10010840_33310 [Deinococcus aerolatus]